MNCPKCGADNPASNIFCDTCGVKLVKKEKKKAHASEAAREEKIGVAAPAAAPQLFAEAPQPVKGANLPDWLTWENLLWLIIFMVGAFLLFYRLGEKPLHHDESLHAFYSWELFKGKGYAYNPMMHGPFLFHANALIYYLFGASDYTCRIVPALTAMLTLWLVYLLRPYLGRAGALFTGGMIAISPSFTYFGRFIRNDIFICAFNLMMVYGLFRWLETKRAKYL
ncbi:TIGR03663 family protein, partial [candidate division FCPU426 bacterium]|nr:TIGR03663 family protein [candidate division FCPU426 bacterium]